MSVSSGFAKDRKLGWACNSVGPAKQLLQLLSRDMIRRIGARLIKSSMILYVVGKEIKISERMSFESV